MTKLVTKNEVFSKVIMAHTRFVNTLLLKGFDHMQEVLGEECYAIALPEDILLWCSVNGNFNEFEHTATIQHEAEKVYLYGNVIITSNDDNGIHGIQDLTEEQLKWLRNNSCLAESHLHKNYVLNFKTY